MGALLEQAVEDRGSLAREVQDRAAEVFLAGMQDDFLLVT
jgi:hypothetical protein